MGEKLFHAVTKEKLKICVNKKLKTIYELIMTEAKGHG
jgi:hypothetical protein